MAMFICATKSARVAGTYQHSAQARRSDARVQRNLFLKLELVLAQRQSVAAALPPHAAGSAIPMVRSVVGCTRRKTYSTTTVTTVPRITEKPSHSVFSVRWLTREEGLIPQRNRAGKREAEADRGDVVGNDANQIERQEERNHDPQKMRERIVDQGHDADARCRWSRSRTR